MVAAFGLACERLKPGDIQSDAGVVDEDPGAIGPDATSGADASTAMATDGRDASGAPPDANDASGTMGDDGDASTADADGDVTDAMVGADASGAGVDGDVSDALVPLRTAGSSLRLWLTADVGLECSGSRVTTWADQSGHQDDAELKQGQLGPQCQGPSSAHSVRGVTLPYFSAPHDRDNIVDETLDVDLSFLAGSDYTIFVVERRWADYPPSTGADAEYFIGTMFPAGYAASFNTTCQPAMNTGLQVGYIYYNGSPALVLDQTCSQIFWYVSTTVDADAGPAALGEETFSLKQSSQRTVWSDGAQVAAAADDRTAPLQFAIDGAIGTAMTREATTQMDPRFRGDIAEVLVYDAALDDTSRQAIEAYLRNHWGY